MAGVNSSELDRAVEEWRGEIGPAQPALPGVAPENLGENLPAGDGSKRRPGRPRGASNLRTEQLARLYRASYGDPLDIATEIAAKDVLDREVVEELARTWGCTRFEAVKLWAAINADANRYHHQQQPRALYFPPGAPGGERIGIEIDGVYQEILTPGDGDGAGGDAATPARAMPSDIADGEAS